MVAAAEPLLGPPSALAAEETALAEGVVEASRTERLGRWEGMMRWERSKARDDRKRCIMEGRNECVVKEGSLETRDREYGVLNQRGKQLNNRDWRLNESLTGVSM